MPVKYMYCLLEIISDSIFYSLFRLSRWNHSKIFSDFGDEETENSDDEYMNAKTASGRRSKASSQLKSKAYSLRSVYDLMLVNLSNCQVLLTICCLSIRGLIHTGY